jgi:hypothetical protein
LAVYAMSSSGNCGSAEDALEESLHYDIATKLQIEP